MTRIPIEKKESFRWIEGVRNSNNLLEEPERLVHIGDREADICELFHQAHHDNSHFLIRIKVNRRTEDETTTISQVFKKAKLRGQHKVTHFDKKGIEVGATLKVRFEKITIKPRYGIKAKNYPDITAVFIYAKEVSNNGGDREPIEWKLITNLPIKTVADPAEKLHWYSLRWKIEVFLKF